MLKKIIIGCALSSCAMISSTAIASGHSVSVGYAQSKVTNFNNIKGVNLQYRYEWESPVSFVSSWTYMQGHESYPFDYAAIDRIDVKYYSLLVGPEYHFNDYFSFYVLAGLAHTKASGERYVPGLFSIKDEVSKNSFAYGAGTSVKPFDNVSIYVGYEGTTAKYGEKVSFNGFNIGIGYHF